MVVGFFLDINPSTVGVMIWRWKFAEISYMCRISNGAISYGHGISNGRISQSSGISQEKG